MSKKTTYLLGMAMTIILGTLLYIKYCCNCCCSNPESVVKPAIEAPVLQLNKFAITGSDFNYQCIDNFRFAKNGSDNLMPIGDSINLGISNLKMFFDKNPNHKLMITGFATKDEKNTSAYPNLGEARANDIKNYFVSKGFTASQFDCKGELRDAWKMNADTLLGPANFKVMLLDATTPEIDWNSVKEKINANPLILYFETNQSEINLTAEERQKVSDIVHYLDNVSGAKISIIGHTDNVGDRKVNIVLGLDRAVFAKEYLVKNDVMADKIDASSKGPDQPIADNNTAEGKSKNRRTVITIK